MQKFTTQEANDFYEIVVERHERGSTVITSNRESQLPKPFLRRCVFHHIEFPDEQRLRLILAERLGHLDLDQRLRDRIVEAFNRIRQVDDLDKKPATGELLAWARVLHRAGVSADHIAGKRPRDLPFRSALIKSVEDQARVEQSG